MAVGEAVCLGVGWLASGRAVSLDGWSDVRVSASGLSSGCQLGRLAYELGLLQAVCLNGWLVVRRSA